MKIATKIAPARNRNGMTVVEIMIAVFIGSIALLVAVVLGIYGLRSFIAISDYAELDAKSRKALDELSRDLRECDTLTGLDFSTNAPYFEFKNSAANTSIRVAWDSAARTVTTSRKDLTTEKVVVTTNLTECDYWSFQIYQQSPKVNTTNQFYGMYEAGTSRPKLVNMTWKCSRRMLDKWHTESVQTAKIVLRNAR